MIPAVDAETEPARPELQVSRPEADTLRLTLAGEWTIRAGTPGIDDLEEQLDPESRPGRIAFDTTRLSGWDSSLLAFLARLFDLCDRRGIAAEKEGLPQGVRRLLALAATVPERKGARRDTASAPWLARIGEGASAGARSIVGTLDFIGGVFTAFSRLLRGKAQFRLTDLLLIIQECGARALPIVALISMLVGLIFAFVGAVQLKMFGAEIYVASLVGIAMVRVMGAIMTGIIMAGRTGAAFAAELGTMQVNEEIDALKTLGISPMEFLVLPRVIALALMMPLLCLFSDLMGIVGGLIVGVFMLDLNAMEYYVQTRESVDLANLWIGLLHSFVFGILVALTGCLQGMKCGRNASAVGRAATSAVVTGIVAIVVATSIITVICDIIGI